MAHENGWRRGDRCWHWPSGQAGVVMGWKDSRLFIYWGSHDCRRFESWVAEEECEWRPTPIEVLNAKGEHVATRPGPDSAAVITPSELTMPEIVLP